MTSSVVGVGSWVITSPPSPFGAQCPRCGNHNLSNRRHTHTGLEAHTRWLGLAQPMPLLLRVCSDTNDWAGAHSLTRYCLLMSPLDLMALKPHAHWGNPPPLWGQCPRFRNHNPSNKRHTHVGLVTDTCWHGLSSISAPTFGSLLWYQRLSWAHYPARCYPLWSPVDLMPFYYLPPIFIRPWFDVMDIEDPLFKHGCYFNPWAYIGRATVYFRGNVFYVYFDILKFLN